MHGCIHNRFQVLHFLARGGMGEVFLAFDMDNGRRAVLKVARDDVPDDEGRRFEHEIEVTRRLRHPRVAKHIADGQWNERRFLALDYIEGPSVADLLDGLQRRLPMRLAVNIALDALDALAAVHGTAADDGALLGLVHRDVSPHNLIIDKAGRCHLIDFGIATDRQFDAPRGIVMGKPGYLAPEQMLGADVDGTTDQFAVGVVLWEMLTGRRLKPNDVANGVVDAAPPSTFVRGVPAALDAFVARLLSAQRTQRFTSCAAAAAALRAAAAHLPRREESFDVEALIEESARAQWTPTVLERLRTLMLTHVATSATGATGA